MMARVQLWGRTLAAVARWPEFAAEARLADRWTRQIQQAHRLAFPKR